MKKSIQQICLGISLAFIILNVKAQNDTLTIHNLGHASLMFEYDSLIIHVDPVDQEADYSSLPDADLIFITHGHGDHYNLTALNKIKKDSTLMVCTQAVKDKGTYTGDMVVMSNGNDSTFRGIPVEAVPAYNHTLSYHPKGVGNGYIFTFGEKRVYVAGDTEDIPEMDSIEADIAFIPMNQPYTMTIPQAVNAALMIDPDVLYIYHFSNSDTALLRSELSAHDSIEVRIGESVYKGDKRLDVDAPEPTGSAELKKDIKPRIYPVPARRTIIVENEFPIVRAAIYNLENKRISQLFPGTTYFEFPVENLASGNYIIEIETDNYITASQFVKY